MSVRLLLRPMGLSSANSPAALPPSPILASASTDHSAAWVYYPPFSRTPGG